MVFYRGSSVEMTVSLPGGARAYQVHVRTFPDLYDECPLRGTCAPSDDKCTFETLHCLEEYGSAGSALNCHREGASYFNCEWHNSETGRPFIRCDDTATNTCVIQLPQPNIFQAEPHPLDDEDCVFQVSDAVDVQPAGCPLNKQCFEWMRENYSTNLAEATYDGAAITC